MQPKRARAENAGGRTLRKPTASREESNLEYLMRRHEAAGAGYASIGSRGTGGRGLDRNAALE